MGQKINPISLRTGIVKPWVSRWFFVSKGKAGLGGKYPYAAFLAEDEAIRAVVRKRIVLAGIAGIDIERTSNHIRVFIKAARPGLIIGRNGEGATKLKEDILKKMDNLKLARPEDFKLEIVEVQNPEADATLVAYMVAEGLEKRMPYRRVIKSIMEKVMSARGVLGARILLSGRLGGAEIARSEELKRGSVPLQSFRADIDFKRERATLSYGVIGIKVWIYRGKIFADKKKEPKS